MQKEKLVKLSEKQIELLREAVTNQKIIEKIKVITNGQSSKKEETIARIYEYENLEKKLN